MSDHVIHLEGDGVLATTPPATVRAIVASGVERGHLVLHIHGGLVSENNARERAADLGACAVEINRIVS